MKKIFYLFTISFLMIAISGCGDKKLECTYESVEDYGKSNLKITIKYDEEPTSVVITDKITFKEDYKEYIDAYYNSISSRWDDFKDKEGFVVETNKNNLEIISNVEADMKKISSDDKSILEINGKIEDIKNVFINNGYTCK